MSGGIDSSVSAFLLKEQGYEVIGAYMNYWHDTSHIPEDQLHTFPENKCCSTESLFAARQIGAELGFPVYTVNYTDQFRNTVVEQFLKAHEKGITPNPCIRCNIDIKFGAFFEKMKELGCDYLATGHYAQIVSKSMSRESISQNTKTTKHPHDSRTLELYAGVDTLKDQSYFLYHLNEEILSRTIFPLGGMHKTEVKALAQKYGLKEILEKKESQGVCFFPEESYVPFLERYIPNIFKEGNVVYHGEIIGKHKGLPRYTIGQRRGVDIGGFPTPIYVTGFDYEKNELLMGNDEELFTDSLLADEWTFTGNLQASDLQNKKLFARIRHLGQLTPCTVDFLENKKVKIHFKEKIRGVTPGQIAVIYDENNRVIGGGVILSNTF